MNHKLAQNAILSALENNWGQAVKINKVLLKHNPADVDAMNRLAKAHYELGETDEAIKFIERVLKIDSLNPIAVKNLERYRSGPAQPNAKKGNGVGSRAHLFLEEPGKTKIVPLIHLVDPSVYLTLDPGDAVELVCGGHRISINTEDGRYIGKLADDIANRINYCIKMGNEFTAYIKSVAAGEVRIFIRETKRDEQFSNTPSFPLERK